METAAVLGRLHSLGYSRATMEQRSLLFNVESWLFITISQEFPKTHNLETIVYKQAGHWMHLTLHTNIPRLPKPPLEVHVSSSGVRARPGLGKTLGGQDHARGLQEQGQSCKHEMKIRPSEDGHHFNLRLSSVTIRIVWMMLGVWCECVSPRWMCYWTDTVQKWGF